MNENIEVIELEELECDDKEVSNIGRNEDSPVWIYLAKLTPESFVRLWQRCGSMEQFQASYQALGGGTCSLECEDSETLPEESVSKILFTAGILRKRGVPLKSWDVTEDTKSDYWDTLSQLAEEEAL